MPIIEHSKAAVAEPYPGARSRALVNQDSGAAALTVGELTLAKDGGVPLHIHAGHEEAIMVIEGSVEAVLGDQKVTVGAGNTILAPAGVKHSLHNSASQPARLITIFPTTSVQRTFF